eukprot:jgi/Botrbrau1/6889/Bobra.67_3s0008.1
MAQLLRQLPSISHKDRGLVEQLRGTAFVPTASGSLLSPSAVYDPRNPDLLGLLDEACFPFSIFAEDESLLAALQVLGMRSTVTPETLLQSARLIESLARTDDIAANARGKALLSYLEVEAGRLFGKGGGSGAGAGSRALALTASLPDRMLAGFPSLLRPAEKRPAEEVANKFWRELGNIAWCPVLAEAPERHLPWAPGTERVAPPSAVRPSSDLWLVSATLRILDGECRSGSLAEALGWTKKVAGGLVAAQLAALGRLHTTVPDLATQQRLSGVVPLLYKELTALDPHDLEVAQHQLMGAPCIWVGDAFTPADRVALSGVLNLAPYLYVIPRDLAPFWQLFVELGVRAAFSPAQFVAVLDQLHTEGKEQPLQPAQLEQALAAVQALADVDFEADVLYVPDSRGVMAPSRDLVYNDAPWLPSAASLRFVHPKISCEVADQIGVASLRSRMVAATADSMQLGLHTAEAFGQSESLTTRLKHIIDVYADGPGILMELIQNADDAGAREVRFLLDRRTHPANSVLGPNMAQWQGPALCCYNDSIFSPADFQNISRIGQDSKLDKPATTGRFGLGFNSVYHFTDVPAFVSGDFLVIFDPHTRYLPCVNPTQPGLKIAFQKQDLLAQFPDAFTPFLLFGCNLRSHFDGTLFRFPLRTEALAAKSEIKSTPYTPAEVEALFEAIRQQATSALLFLKSVQRLAFYVQDTGDKAPRLLFRAALESPGDVSPQTPITRFIGAGTGAGSDFQRRLAGTSASALPSSIEIVRTTLTQGAASDSRPQEERWLLANALAGGRPQALAVEGAQRGRGLVPWVGVAARLPLLSPVDPPVSSGERRRHRGGNGPQRSLDGPQRHASTWQDKATPLLKGQVFCFLPLPLFSGLPIHVNGFFELSSNRRDIWHGEDMAGSGKLRSDWNLALIEDALAPTYARTLAAAAQDIGPCPAYYKLWPIGKPSGPWVSLQKQFYLQAAAHPVMWTETKGGNWIEPRAGLLPDEAILTYPDLARLVTGVEIPLIGPLPDAVLMACRHNMPGVPTVKPSVLRQSFRRHRPHNYLMQLSLDERIKVAAQALQYCLSDLGTGRDGRDGSNGEELEGLPLVVLRDGSIASLRRRIPPSRAAQPRDHVEDIFVVSPAQRELFQRNAPSLVAYEVGTPLGDRLAEIARTGNWNLQTLSAEALAATFLPTVLPLAWRGREQVAWQASSLPPQFLQGLWGLLREMPNLAPLEAWPILPVRGGHLVRAQPASQVLEEGSWSEGVESGLKALGCHVIDAPALGTEASAPQACGCVFPATGRGLLAALAVGTGLSGSSRLSPAERDQLRSFLLQERWYRGYDPSEAEMEVLRKLPIYVAANSHPLQPQYTDVASSRLVAPADTAHELLSPDFIRSPTEGETAVLVQLLGAKQVSYGQLLSEHVYPRIGEIAAGARDRCMLEVVRRVPVLAMEQPDAVGQLSCLAFVPTLAGSLATANRLYDPRVTGFQALLDPQTAFPAPPFDSDQEVLEGLKLLGLRSSLGPETLVEAAATLDLQQQVDESCQNRAKALLAQLDNFALEQEGGGSSEGDENRAMWAQLTTKAWCPIVREPPEHGLPWPPSQIKLAPPKIVRPQGDMWLVSASMHLLDGACSGALAGYMGWDEPLQAQILASQLLELGGMHPEVEGDATRAMLGEAAESIYAALGLRIEDASDKETVSMILQGHPCIWTGSGFLTASAVAFSSPPEWDPFLCQVPPPYCPTRISFLSLR